MAIDGDNPELFGEPDEFDVALQEMIDEGSGEMDPEEKAYLDQQHDTNLSLVYGALERNGVSVMPEILDIFSDYEAMNRYFVDEENVANGDLWRFAGRFNAIYSNLGMLQDSDDIYLESYQASAITSAINLEDPEWPSWLVSIDELFGHASFDKNLSEDEIKTVILSMQDQDEADADLVASNVVKLEVVTADLEPLIAEHFREHDHNYRLAKALAAELTTATNPNFPSIEFYQGDTDKIALEMGIPEQDLPLLRSLAKGMLFGTFGDQVEE